MYVWINHKLYKFCNHNRRGLETFGFLLCLIYLLVILLNKLHKIERFFWIHFNWNNHFTLTAWEYWNHVHFNENCLTTLASSISCAVNDKVLLIDPSECVCFSWKKEFLRCSQVHWDTFNVNVLGSVSNHLHVGMTYMYLR